MKTENCEIKIRGMICQSCTDEVSGMLLQTKGVIKASVSYCKALAAVMMGLNPRSFAKSSCLSRSFLCSKSCIVWSSMLAYRL